MVNKLGATLWNQAVPILKLMVWDNGTKFMIWKIDILLKELIDRKTMEHLQIKEYLQWQRPMQSSEWGQKIKTPVEDKNKQVRGNFIKPGGCYS